MCILFFISNGNPNPGTYKLILASNRDEYYARPALPAAVWEENEFVYGGRDLEPGKEGGSWLAISTKNNIIKLGAILNITGEPKHKISLGRGPLVSNYVCGNLTNEDYCKEIINTEIPYNTFNLVTIEIKNEISSILHCSNVPKGIQEWMPDKPLVFGNSPPDTPLEKVKAGKNKFIKILNQHQQQQREQLKNEEQLKHNLIENLLELLKYSKKYWPDSELEKRAPEWGEQLSSINVKIPNVGYGSRTHTIILIDWKNQMDFYEETMATNDPNGEWKKTHFQKQL